MTLNGHSKKTNLSKIASKEVKIYVFENYFLKKGVVQQLPLLYEAITFHIPIFTFHLVFKFSLSAYFTGAQVLSILT